MSQVIENLRQLNSKERFFLIGYALGNRAFYPSPEMRNDLQKAFSLKLPRSVFASMDFHLDWIFAALKLAFSRTKQTVFPIEIDCIKARPEDIDFLIAYDRGKLCHIVLLEAKGVTGWSNSQMDSKAKRFQKIFGKKGDRWPGVVPHFALISPRRPNGLQAMSGQHGWLLKA
jgi:hypothetical protein